MISAKKFARKTQRRRANERGQAVVFLVFALGIFLIGGIGLVVDGANLWFHRQSAQTAADAACASAAMDMLSLAAGVTPADPNWIPSSDDGSVFHCSGTTGSAGNTTPNSTFPPCQYAALNGYSGSGSQDVQVSFPAGLSFTAECPNGNVCAADDVAATPYVKVTVNDTVPTTFMRLVGASPSTMVPAKATCGLSNVLSPVPMLVLNPNLADAMSGSGFTLSVNFSTPATQNPPKVLQVNSSNSDAVTALSGTIDLSNADGSKGNFGIGGQSTPSSDGSYTVINVAGVVSDPFASIVPPAQPPQAGTFSPRVTSPDCPQGSPTCDIYTPGYWPGLTVQPNGGVGRGPNAPTGLAVFEPGIYYLDGPFIADDPQTCIRPSINSGSGGVVFYFHTGSLQINSQSGQLIRFNGFNCQSNTVPVSVLACPSATAANLPSGGIGGNVLLAPCEGTYPDINGNQQVAGDPLGTSDPIGEQRGMLFFQDRDSTATPIWSPAGTFGLIGNIYFHHCGSGAGSGANCISTAFDDTLTLGSGGNAYIVGDVVVDQLAINSGSNINVGLNPNPQYYVLKASLLQ
jgi:Putative Flp pilus-assembly TadE/G-like/Putative Tad-like Flp pilus-assembly